jgi:hypothetical protein
LAVRKASISGELEGMVLDDWAFGFSQINMQRQMQLKTRHVEIDLYDRFSEICKWFTF